ncbi:nipblb [Symbiodinium sp. CCMP2592]|nr:nipblb [Symbiodinium sp. CCMP2592]
MPRNAKREGRAPRERSFAGEANEAGLCITDLHQAWDSTCDVRQRLREGQGLMHPNSGLQCDNAVCVLNSGLLLPLLHRMSESSERKLPSVGDLRSEMTKVFAINKRVGADVQSCVAAEAIHVRKLLSFIKAKVRREEAEKPVLTRRDQLVLRSRVKGSKKRGPKRGSKKSQGKGIKRGKSLPLSPSKRRRKILREVAEDRDEDHEPEGEHEVEATEKEGTKKLSPQKEIIMKPAELCMFEALDWYFGVKDPAGLKEIIVTFAKKWASCADDKKGKHELKGALDEIWYCGYNMYWNRPAAGVLHKETGKELAYFSIPATRSENCSWGQKMAVVAKAANMFASYADSLIYDGYVDSTKPDTSKDLVIMRNIFKSVVEGSVKKLAESG